MALVFFDRVRETSTVTGTNDATLLGAVTGFQAFSVVGNGNTCYYTIADQSGGNWECGIGTYSSVGPTLQRTTILSSSNSGNKVAFGAGTKDVFLTYPSSKAVYLDASNNAQPNLGNASATQLNITGQGDLRLEDTTGGEYVALQAPGTLASSYTLTLPVDDGTSGQALVTDGNGVLSWSTAASGDVYGPASSTTNAIPTFADTTGKLLQNNSGVTISSNTVTASGGFSTAANLTFTGTGNRITGDMSNATVSNRLAIQTSTANSTTTLNMLPSGTGTGVRFDMFAASDANNSAYMRIGHNGTVGYLSTSYYGTGVDTPMAMFTAGSERLRIDTSGNVGIGNTVASTINTENNSGNLVVGAGNTTEGITVYSGNTSIGALCFADGTTTTTTYAGYLSYLHASDAMTLATNATERMRITSSGNVGIGTSSPSYLLDISNNQNGITAFRITNANSGSSAYTAMYFGNDLNSAQAGFFTTSSTNNTFGGVNTFNIWTQTSGSPAPIVFCPNNTERMRIDTSGNVGIGITPTVRLNVHNALSIGEIGRFSSAQGSGEIQLNLGFTTTNQLSMFYALGTGDGGLSTNVGSANLIFRTASTERMRIDSSGNVGIGTSSPSSITGGRCLTLSNTGFATLSVQAIDGGNDRNASLELLSSGNGGSFSQILYGDTDTTPSSLSPLVFASYYNAARTERMRITSDGDLALGTATAFGTGTNRRVFSINGTTETNFTMGTGGSQRFYMFLDSSILQTGTQTAIPFTFVTNNTERMRITSTGAVGIGNINPGALLHVTNNSNTYAGGILIGSAGVASGYISTTDNLYIKPNTTANTTSGVVVIQDFSNANKITLSSVNGTIGLGGASVASTGVGITFPATQSASSDANTLDDYEEGTFTPTVLTGFTGVTYNQQFGKYTKIGNVVNFQIRIQFSGTGNGAGLNLAGLPFTSFNGTPNGGAFSTYFDAIAVDAVWYVPGNLTNIEAYVNGSTTQPSTSGTVTNKFIIIAGQYFSNV